jgi:hypothetical protein
VVIPKCSLHVATKAALHKIIAKLPFRLTYSFVYMFINTYDIDINISSKLIIYVTSTYTMNSNENVLLL